MEKQSVIIFVHGIGANHDKWWGTTKYFLKNDMDIKKYAIVDFWGYRTTKLTTPKNRFLNLFGKGTVLANFHDLGMDLIGYITREHKDKKSIILFGHSMGGLIISEALKYSKEYQINIQEIVMCGTPLDGSRLIDFFSNVFRFMYLDCIFRLLRSDHAKFLIKDYGIVQNISNTISKLVTLDRKNTGHTLLTFMKIIEDEVVSTDQERFGPFLDQMNTDKIQYYTLQGGHSDCIINLNSHDNNYKSIKHWIFDALMISSQQDMSYDIEQIINTSIQKFGFDFSTLSKLDSNEIDYLCRELNKFDGIRVEEDFKLELSKKEALEYAYQRKKELTLKVEQGLSLTKIEEFELKVANKNYIAIENTQTKTITQTGNEIIIIEEKIEVTSDGDCTFNFIRDFRIPNEKALDSSTFEDASSNNRFTDLSYSAKILDYTKINGDTRTVIPSVSISEWNDGEYPGIHLKINVNDCNEGEKFKLLFSLTIPEEYTDEKIKLMKEDKTLCPVTHFLSSFAVRNIIIQEEAYNCQPNVLVQPSIRLYQDEEALRCNLPSERLDPKPEENLFYKKYSWTIYFSDYEHGIYVYTPF